MTIIYFTFHISRLSLKYTVYRQKLNIQIQSNYPIFLHQIIFDNLDFDRSPFIRIYVLNIRNLNLIITSPFTINLHSKFGNHLRQWTALLHVPHIETDSEIMKSIKSANSQELKINLTTFRI